MPEKALVEHPLLQNERNLRHIFAKERVGKHAFEHGLHLAVFYLNEEVLEPQVGAHEAAERAEQKHAVDVHKGFELGVEADKRVRSLQVYFRSAPEDEPQANGIGGR